MATTKKCKHKISMAIFDQSPNQHSQFSRISLQNADSF